jgi:hypothetical protein
MSLVYKYQFDESGQLFVPFGKVVLVSTQYNPGEMVPTVWVEHTNDELKSDQRMGLQLFGTAHEVDTFILEFKGSCICNHGALVWHVYGTPRQARKI